MSSDRFFPLYQLLDVLLGSTVVHSRDDISARGHLHGQRRSSSGQPQVVGNAHYHRPRCLTGQLDNWVESKTLLQIVSHIFDVYYHTA